jgi:CheY-like chemotaxis protein
MWLGRIPAGAETGGADRRGRTFVTAATILVVDDSEDGRELARIALTSAGFTVLEAADSQSAVDAFTRHRPKFVLQDLLLPDIDGIDLVQQIRALPGGPEAIILVVSSWVARSGRAQREDLGFDGYLTKPVSPEELVATVRDYASHGWTSAAAEAVEKLRSAGSGTGGPMANLLDAHRVVTDSLRDRPTSIKLPPPRPKDAAPRPKPRRPPPQT